MSVNAINNSYTASTDTTRTTGSSELGKDEFLKLLVTQLKYQDPLSPMDNTEYVSQLAQFSTLEYMGNMSTGISNMEALNMTGKYITADYTDSSGTVTEVSGIVDSVKLKDGKAVLLVEDKEISIDDVKEVTNYSRGDASELSAMIGKTCTGYIYDSSTLEVISVEGKVSGISKGVYEDYVVMDGVVCELDSILSDDYSSSEDKLEYLQEHVGEELDLNVTDSTTGKVVPVTAKLESVSEDDGKITVTLNGLHVPVDGIYKINE